MESPGFIRGEDVKRLHIVSAFSVTLGILAGTIGFAGPVSAAPATWQMPNVKNMVLHKAVKAVRDAAGPAELNLNLEDSRNGQAVHNQTNWQVCYQSPSAGKTITQKAEATYVYLYVKRFNQSGSSTFSVQSARSLCCGPLFAGAVESYPAR